MAKLPPFSHFIERETGGYASYQIKVTYLYLQYKAFPTIVLHSFQRCPDMREFERFSRPGVSYLNDHMLCWVLSLRNADIGKLLAGIGAHAGLTDHRVVPSEPVFSFMITRWRNDRVAGFESLVDETNSPLLARAVGGLVDNAETLRTEMIGRWRTIINL
ncbi:MAG: hypothetical protein ABSH26_16400 [Opitutaceae bacterium]|jgi:hypothetical protein